jgi:putative nucleotidyltransferase with HDIG domain
MKESMWWRISSHEHIGRWRELPAVLAATTLVSVLPAVVATRLLPSLSLASMVMSALLAVGLSAIAAHLGAALWSRKRGSRDVLFADLMAWGWVRRRLADRRLATIQRRLADADGRDGSMPMAGLARLARLLGSRDVYTYGHSRRVARYAQSIARGMRLPSAGVEQIRQAAVVHDIGKLHTPSAILAKPGPLSDAEFAIVKRHPAAGAAMLAHIGDADLVAMVLHHHERLDGNGYPDGLRGEAIPVGARIIAVADTFDALTSTRSYRRPVTHKKALEILSTEAGTQLDPEAVAAFLRHYSAGRSAAWTAAFSNAGQRLLTWLQSGATGVSGSVTSFATAVPVTGAAALIALGGGLHISSAAPTPSSPPPSAPVALGAETPARQAPFLRRRPTHTADRAPTVGGRPAPSPLSPTQTRRPSPSADAPAGPSASADAPAGPTRPAAPIAERPHDPAAAEVPALPALPSIPSTPTVTVPPVRVPEVSAPTPTPTVDPPLATAGVPTPTVEVPPVSVPDLQRPGAVIPSPTAISAPSPMAEGRRPGSGTTKPPS